MRWPLLLSALVLLAPAARAQAPASAPGDRPGITLVGAFEQGGRAVDDTWINTTIQSKLVSDPELRHRHLGVTTRDGVVYLRGNVRSEEERRHAIELARHTKGVVQVAGDELHIGPRIGG
jgi:hyperosmotically inducible protein